MLSSANKTRILDKCVPCRYNTPGPRKFHAITGSNPGGNAPVTYRGTTWGLCTLLLGGQADVSTYWVSRPMTQGEIGFMSFLDLSFILAA